MASRHDIIQIDFRANAGRANPAIESLRQAAKSSRDEIARLNKELADGKAAGKAKEDLDKLGKQIAEEEKKLKSFTRSERELVKGVDALSRAIEAFNNGTLDKMSAAFQKTAQNAANLARSRINPDTAQGKKDIAELDAVILATQKNLVKSKEDFKTLVQTIESGGKISVAELNMAKTSLEELSRLTAQGTKEWKTYQSQLSIVEAKVRSITVEEQRMAGQKTLGQAFRGDFAGADVKTLELAIAKLKEYQSVIADPEGKGARHFAATKTQIEALTTQLNNAKGVIATVEAAMQKAADIVGREVTSVSTRIEQATAATRSNIATVDAKIEATTSEMRRLESAMDAINQPQNVTSLIAQMEQATAEIQRQHAAKEQFIKTTEQERLAREKTIEEQKAMVAWAQAEQKAYANNIKSIEGQIKYEEQHLQMLKATREQILQGPGTTHNTDDVDALIVQHQKVLEKVKERKVAMEAANQTAAQLAAANERLAATIKADAEASAQAQAAIQAFDAQIAAAEGSVAQLQQQLNTMYNPASVQQLETELARLTAEYQQQKDARAQLVAQAEVEREERKRNIDALKQEISTLQEQNKQAMDGYIAKSHALDDEMAKLRNLQRVREMNARAQENEHFTEDEAFTEKTGWKPKSLKERYPIEDLDRMIEATQRSIATLTKQRDEMDATLTSTSQRLGKATQELTQASQENEQALAASNRAIKAYDEQIKQLEADIATYTKQLEAAKAAQNTQEYQRMAQQLQQLQGEIVSMTEQREKYVATMKQEEEAAIRLAEAEKAEAIAAQENVTVEDLEQSISVLEASRKRIAINTEEWERQGKALDVLKERLESTKPEFMSLAEAMTLAEEAGTDAFIASPEQLQKATAAIERRKKQLQETIQLQRRSGEATDAEEKELKELAVQLEKLKMEQDNFNMSHSRMDALLEQPTNARNLEELSAAIKRARAELRIMEDSLGKNSQAYKDMAAKVKQAEIQLKQMEAQSKGTASAFEKAWSRLKTYVGLYVGAAVAMQKIVATMGDLMELSDKMGEVRKTTGFTADEVGRLTTELKKLDTRTSVVELLNLSAAAGQLGLKSQQEIQGFTEAANQLIVALPEMGRESATTLMKIANATGDLERNNNDVRETMERIGSTIIALRANSASAAPAITDFVSRVGAVGAQAGISIDQIAALGSTIDALGGRVEMSATALSRMIPAIRNNAFGVANAIGVTEKSLTDLFNSGRAMEAMVLIFQKMRESVKGFDTSTEEGMNAMADNVEALLGRNAAMGEVMKELNQQGARAGIVFGLLSQNVDELEKQLDTASEAYKQNTALMNEYNNMNETTAAKWERLKNQIEEMFVGDRAQRWLGGIIDGLRKIVDWIAEDGPIVKGLKIIAVYAAAMKMGLGASIAGAGGAFKNLWIGVQSGINVFATALGAIVNSSTTATQSLRGLRMATINARREWIKMDAVMKANIWGAVIAALGAIAFKLWDMHKAAKEAAAEVGRFNDKVAQEKKALDDLFTPLNKSNIAQDQRSKLISEINSKYSKYLGYMLSETTHAIQLADAHALIAKRIREEAYEKRILEQEDKVRDKHGSDVNAAYGRIEEQVRKGKTAGTDVADVSAVLKEVIDRNIASISDVKDAGDLGDNRYVELSPAAQKQLASALDTLVKEGKLSQKNVSLVTGAVMRYAVEAKEQYNDMLAATANTRADLRNVQRGIQGDIKTNLTGLVNSIKNFGQKPVMATPSPVKPQEQPMTFTFGQQRSTGTPSWVQMPGQQSQSQTAPAEPVQLPQIDKKDVEQVKQYVEMQDQLRGYLQANAGNIDEQTRKTAEMYLESEESMKELRALLPKDTNPNGGGGGNGSTNPYGNYNPVTSPYEDWNADALVARRKEMLERVRALANGADVQAVLSEDAKFITEATRNNIKTTKEAIEWYNTERLKIQDALHEKHLTNTGDWMDPKKGRKRKPQFYESDYALAELDRYYSHRKELLEKAREEENMTEELYNREVELLEQEHLAKRSKLRESFTSKDKQMISGFRQWWAKLAETGDLAEVPWATVESEWAKATDAQWGANNRKAQEDLTKLQEITVKHLNAIAKIIDKERPYDGITANLRDNLTKMDILFADYQKNGPTEDTSVLVKAGTERLKFLLEEAETAYSSTIEDVLRRMGKAGMTAWAEEIRKSPAMQNALMAQLQTAYDEIQNAIKKEATLIRKQTDIWWNDIAKGETQSRKGVFEKAISDMGLLGDQVKRANSLIGAGQASERVADKLAIKQMQLRLQMQQVYYDRMRQMWADRIASLRAQGKEIDAQHAEMSRNLSLTEEQKKLDKQRVAIANQLEESQNRLYTELKSWADLLTSSLQSVFEASNAGNAEYYNELAKLNLTGSGGPGAGTYVVIDNAGTSDATAHYEYLDEREALERQHEIEQQNAQAEAWKKVMDDINMKMSETITDQLNAMLQNASVDANTDALGVNTDAMNGLSGAITNLSSVITAKGAEIAAGSQPSAGTSAVETPQGQTGGDDAVSPVFLNPEDANGWSWIYEQDAAAAEAAAERKVAASEKVEEALRRQFHTQTETSTEGNRKTQQSTQTMFAKMTMAANMYGIAYQAMSNENLSTTQKFEMMALQAVGNYAIGALTTEMAAASAKAATDSPGVLGKLWKDLGWAAAPVFAIFTGLLGGLMGLATSKISKAKSTIAQATGASAGAGRLATGMLTYAEGNVNEFTDPSTLTPGRQYNVDAADGRTYRARYMGSNPKTHLTNGPEFHLSGERGREMIIDAGTTRQITMNEAEIWHAIQTLSGGGGVHRRRTSMRRGVAAFADGNLDEFEGAPDGGTAESAGGMSMEMAASLQASIDRQSDLLERAINDGIKGVFSIYGKGGLVDSYDSGKKTLNRYGERY